MKSKICKVFNNNLFMLNLAWKQSKTYFCVFVLIVVITVIKDLVLVIAPKYIFDSMQYENSIKAIIIPVFMYVSLYFVLFVLLHFLSYFKTTLESKFKMVLNVKLGEKFLKVDYSFLEDNKSIDMFNRAKIAISGGLNDIQTLGLGGEQGLTGYFDQLFKIIKDIILLCSVLYVFSYMEIYLFFIVALCVMLNLVFSMIKMKATINVREKAGPYLTKSRYCNKLLRTFEYGKEFRVFGMTDFIVSKFHDCTNEYVDVRNASKTPSCASSVMFNIVNNIMRLAVLVCLIFKLGDESISVGDFSMIFAAILTFSHTAQDLFNAVLSLNIFSSFMMDYQKCMSLKDGDDNISDIELSAEPHVVELRNVWFKYNNASEYALKNINVVFKPYENISIVGFNGAGKTTFIKLLLGLYKPTQGQILIDRKNIEEYSTKSLRRYMSVVFQDYKIFAMSIEENIALEKEIDEKALKESIIRSEIGEKIESLEKKEKAIIGGFFNEGDLLLSGGESQKIAMSRSFYRKTGLIALDEPTSTLDVFSEDKMYNSIAKHSEKELILFISHRLASTRFCNRILVFDSGSIAEEGTHQNLLENKGIYYNMWNVQAEKFNGRNSYEE